MEITKISVQARNSERINLQVDGKFYRGLDRLVVIKLGLKPGLTLTPKLLDQLTTTQSENSAWEWVLRSLKISPKSVKEIRRKLQAKFEAEVTDELIKRLLSAGLLDDQRFAEQLVNRLVAQGTKSKREILLKLRQKGIDFEIAKLVLETTDSDATSALKLARIKNRSLKANLTWRERYEKLANYLARKGFGYGEIKQVLTPTNLDLKTN